MNLFSPHFLKYLDLKDPLIVLAEETNWNTFEEAFEKHFKNGKGQPPKPIRLVVSLLMLQHMLGLSDEQVVEKWKQNPYWQYFSGYGVLQWKTPIDASSLSRWRSRLGRTGMDKILSATLQQAVKSKLLQPKDCTKLIVDTTVMEKNITPPTDSNLLNRVRKKIVSWTKDHGIKLRQSYSRLSEQAKRKAGSYAHAKQFKRMQGSLKKLKTYLGRVVRDVKRKTSPSTLQAATLATLLHQADRLLTQEKNSKNKLYSLHEPAVYCMTKGKINKRYEFGSKVSLSVTHKQGLVVSAHAVPKPAYDGHTLSESLEKSAINSGIKPVTVFGDRGYKGHNVIDAQVYISGQRRGMTPSLKRALKRRSAIEPHIGHMKSEGKLGRNYLKGVLGDEINATLCAVGHNLRLIMNHIAKKSRSSTQPALARY